MLARIKKEKTYHGSNAVLPWIICQKHNSINSFIKDVWRNYCFLDTFGAEIMN